jgi:rubrerythrin
VLSGHEKIEDVLRAAIGMEKDSVIFYLGLRDLVPSGAGRERVEAIIREELSHISAINREFKRSK